MCDVEGSWQLVIGGKLSYCRQVWDVFIDPSLTVVRIRMLFIINVDS